MHNSQNTYNAQFIFPLKKKKDLDCRKYKKVQK